MHWNSILRHHAGIHPSSDLVGGAVEVHGPVPEERDVTVAHGTPVVAVGHVTRQWRHGQVVQVPVLPGGDLQDMGEGGDALIFYWDIF